MMGTDFVNGDRTKAVIEHAAGLPWLPSPEAGVERRMLERIGGEVALATSIVRYRAGSRFKAHVHDFGEEFLVLEGTFSDEHGHYPAGSYVRNPPGSRHAPFSEAGCVIFVKLRQMQPAGQDRVVRRSGQLHWSPAAVPLQRSALLHAGGGELVSMESLQPGCTIPARACPGGEEILVVSGEVRIRDGGEMLRAWSWFRNPSARQPPLTSDSGALLWVKRGHLAGS